MLTSRSKRFFAIFFFAETRRENLIQYMIFQQWKRRLVCVTWAFNAFVFKVDLNMAGMAVTMRGTIFRDIWWQSENVIYVIIASPSKDF